MKNFKKTLMKAHLGDKKAIEEIVDMYHGLILKESVVNGEFDPDLRQHLYHTLLICIRRFQI